MPAGATYESIATTTLGSAQASVTFSSISGSYTDLVLIINGKLTTTGNGMFVRINSDTGTNYSTTNVNGNGTSATSGRHTNNSNGIHIGSWQSGSSADFAVSITHFMNYANTTTYKTAINRCSVPDADAQVGLWRNTNAITSLTLRTDNVSNTWASGSTFTLYGILAA